jgi:hypothetical protein
MGLFSLLHTTGTLQSAHNHYGISPSNEIPINPLATKQSNLHYNNSTETEGYSVVGKEASDAFSTLQDYISYNDGDLTNTLPPATILDLNDPIGPDPNYKPKYTSQPGKGYINNLPK